MSAIDLARVLLTEFDGFRGLDAASASELCAPVLFRSRVSCLQILLLTFEITFRIFRFDVVCTTGLSQKSKRNTQGGYR